MNIAGREIGIGHPPYVVAEISGNHAGSLEFAKSLISAAARAGADAVKFQAYHPNTITLDCAQPDFYVKDGPWRGQRLYDLYHRTHTPFGWFPDLFKRAQCRDITIFASVFDHSSVDMLERLDCPAYKIASMEIVDIPLIKYAASTGKPVIISTGMAGDSEILDAIVAAPTALFLHCVSGYPTRIADSRLRSLKPGWGISDHTSGIEVPIAATVLGAVLIEKHLRLADATTDDADFSLRPDAFARMVEGVHGVWESMRFEPRDCEWSSRQLRRSLYVVADIKKGEAFTHANVRSIRPSYGLPPKMLPEVLTKLAACDIVRGTALREAMLA